MSEGENRTVYLPHTLARAVRDAKAAARPVTLSEAAARGIARALNGHAPAVDQDQGAEVSAQLAAIEQELAGIRAEQRRQAATLPYAAARAVCEAREAGRPVSLAEAA